MRKIYNTLLMALLLVVAGSCDQTQDHIFKKSSIVRVQEQVDALSTALAAHPNGWSVAYFYGAAGAEHGGTTLLWKFDDKTSTATAASIATGVDKTYTSNYTVKATGSALLTFDTYNKAVHLFSDPVLPNEAVGDNKGLEGDFEFIVQSITADKIVLLGSKYRTPIVMTPLADNADWTATLKATKVQDDKLIAPFYDFYLNGKKLTGETSFTDHFIDMQVPVSSTESFEIEAPVIATAAGFDTMEPFSFTKDDKNPTVQHFTYDAKLKRFVCSDAGVDFYVQKVYPPLIPSLLTTLKDKLCSFGFKLAVDNSIIFNGMSTKVEIMLKNASAENGTELLNTVKIGQNPVQDPTSSPSLTAFYFRSFDGSSNWGVSFGYEMTAVKGATDQVVFSHISGELNSKFYMPFYNDFIKPIVNAGPYKVVTNSLYTEYKLTSVSNPDIWFTIYK